ncbi:hypothetical protein CC86DRAFT_162652 [Ophiobolus disseminans]|uniref:Uncharacterized protein n=1 Tax=Ophiobolus disseminans TaxID=1469910 RepID=A0A6A7AB48_9PLEO|nr:hypothetical protein CC86DRAFT_162652 [Ophiobolus disseminans]
MDIDDFPEAPSIYCARQLPTQSAYPTSDPEDREQPNVTHGWAAHNMGQTGRRREGHATSFKPRNGFPRTKDNWVPMPEATCGLQQRSEVNDAWAEDFAAKLPYLKRKGYIKDDEDVSTNFLEWAFKAVKSSKRRPFEAGRNYVTPQSKVTIVFRCPVRYDRQARENLKRIGSKAAMRAKIGMVVSVDVGRVENAEKAQFEFDDTHKHDLTNVYMVPEPNAALTYFLHGTTVTLVNIGGGTTNSAAYDLERVGEDNFRCIRAIEPIGDSCGIHMLVENVKGISLRKLAPIKAELETTMRTPLDHLVNKQVVDNFEIKYKPSTNWASLRNPMLRRGMVFWFPGLVSTNDTHVGCLTDSFFTIFSPSQVKRHFRRCSNHGLPLMQSCLRRRS